MNKNFVIKKCNKCNAMIRVIEDCNCPNCGIICCGEPMETVIDNTVEETQKHIPTYKRVEDEIFVQVNHVMDKEHYIKWIALVTDCKEKMVTLFPEQNAECRFKYIPGAKLYAYCNKHGLWSTDVK